MSPSNDSVTCASRLHNSSVEKFGTRQSCWSTCHTLVYKNMYSCIVRVRVCVYCHLGYWSFSFFCSSAFSLICRARCHFHGERVSTINRFVSLIAHTPSRTLPARQVNRFPLFLVFWVDEKKTTRIRTHDLHSSRCQWKISEGTNPLNLRGDHPRYMIQVQQYRKTWE